MENRILTLYQTFRFKDEYWHLSADERKSILNQLLKPSETLSDATYHYQVSPSRKEYDFMIWYTKKAVEDNTADLFFRELGSIFSKVRRYIEITDNFWGYTKPSQYSRSSKSAQEIDPFDASFRTPYFIVYPFTKTIPWYLESGEERMRMMKGHISLGKQYREINQLLIYSFGLQDQEFVVSYECDKLPQFSDLVYDLRATEARKYTENDTPIITGVLRSAEELEEIYT